MKPIVSAYDSLAGSKKISFNFEVKEEPVHVYMDRDKMEKVFHNVLSNTFKFTPKGGEITLTLDTAKNEGNHFAQVAIRDRGRGIPQDQLGNIFNRFYQANNSGKSEHEGTGLGLALSKKLITLHNGNIAVESAPGEGSCFTLSLPLGNKHFSEEQIRAVPAAEKTEEKDTLTNGMPVATGEIVTNEEAAPAETPAEVPQLLVVEDNSDMRQFLHQILDSHYQVTEAKNGLEGWEQAIEMIPDLVISDIMMPEMDGLELCNRLKEDERTGHIPVVLLTAKAGKAHKIEGLKMQADDYLSKPFDEQELLIVIKNRIEQRAALRAHFSSEVTLQPQKIAITSAEERFLQKAMDMVEKHMDDFDYSVAQFTEQMQMGRSQLTRKLKALTNQTPVQFIRSMRLKRAARKVAQNENTISQIAYSVGFNNLSYFTSCFKEQFGQNPSEYTAD